MWTGVVDSFSVFKQYQYTGMLAHTWNLGSQEVNRGGPKVRGQQEFHLHLQKKKIKNRKSEWINKEMKMGRNNYKMC